GGRAGRGGAGRGIDSGGAGWTWGGCREGSCVSHSPLTRRRWSFWPDGLLDLDDLALRVQVDDVAHGWALTLDRVEDDQTAVTGVLFADAGETSGGAVAPVHAVDEALLIGVA